MKKTLTALTMCLLLLDTVATAATASASTEGEIAKSNIIQFDAGGPNGVRGKITINTNTCEFVCDCHGLYAVTIYKLVFRVCDLMGAHFIKAVSLIVAEKSS